MLKKILLLAIVLSAALAYDGKCNLLVIEGGADMGAYEAGAIKAFIYNLPPAEDSWDIFSGISVGAITSVALNQFGIDPQSSRDMVDWLVGIWEDITRGNVWKMWSPGGLVQGLLYEKGLFDDSPLRTYMQSHLTKPAQRWMNIGATDIDTIDLVRYDETTIGNRLVEAVVSSASVPLVFPWNSLDGYKFFDGGVVHMMDIPGGIERCRKEGFADPDIVIDILMIASNQSLENWGPNPQKKTLEVYKRVQNIKAYEKAFKEYVEAVDFYPQANFRYFISPAQPLPDAKFPFFFIKSQLEEMLQLGWNDAMAAMKKGEGVSAREAYYHGLEVMMRRMDPEYERDMFTQQHHDEVMSILKSQQNQNIKASVN